ncbi:MAG TPA: alpha/beta hydrolase [Bacteriovoracaceae bacterium]|nr:alpha/beta hydrolase [Bacteriovoracaceae bacterium]
MSEIHYTRSGSGKPLLLIHGLGGSSKSWQPVVSLLERHREVIAVDLPGFGTSPGCSQSTLRSLTQALTEFLISNDLQGIDVVGHSMGGRIAIELARGNHIGAMVLIGPAGFFKGWERHLTYTTLLLVRLLAKWFMPLLTSLNRSHTLRKIAFFQLSPNISVVSPAVVSQKIRDLSKSRSFEPLLTELCYRSQLLEGGTPLTQPLTFIWGKKDRICFPRQAPRAARQFPQAKLHLLENCGHFPHWDSPEKISRLILEAL